MDRSKEQLLLQRAPGCLLLPSFARQMLGFTYLIYLMVYLLVIMFIITCISAVVCFCLRSFVFRILLCYRLLRIYETYSLNPKVRRMLSSLAKCYRSSTEWVSFSSVTWIDLLLTSCF